MAMQRVRLIGRFDGKALTRWFSDDELNQMWGFCAKMAFLVPGVYSAMMIERLPDEDYAAWVRERAERDRATETARLAWQRFVAGESEAQ